jgi:carbon-monoxide dehydrogenase medium subunit
MKAPIFAYRRAQSVEQAAALAAGEFDAPRYMAGGQSLMPMMNLRLATADALIDVSGLPELRRCEREPDGGLFVGAGITHAMVEDGRVEDVTRGYLRHVASGIAYRSVRNRGTVGGSLAHADPAADWPTALRALDAVAVLGRKGAQRRVPLADFQLGLMETCLEEGELLFGVVLPVLSPQARWSYQKFSRKVGEFAHSIAAVVNDPERGLANVILGAAADTPQRLARASELLAAGKARQGAELDAAIDGDVNEATGFAAGSYDFQLHRTLVRRALGEACKP